MLRKYTVRSRPLDESEFYFVSKEAMEFVQLSFELDSSASVSNFVNQLKYSVAGLHARCDRDRLFSINRHLSEIPVYSIPSHLRTLKAVNQWMYLNHTPEINDRLAEIACDDHRVVINSSHVCADGGYLASLVKGIQTKEGLPAHPTLPGSIVSILNDELTRVKSNKEIKLAGPDSVTYLLNQKEDVNVPENCKAYSIIQSDDSKSLACYDEKKKKINGLTEHMWCGLSLSICALNNEIGPIGVNTCVDFRRLVKPQSRVSNEMTNFFGVVNIVADHFDDPNLKISDLSKQFRDHFNYVINSDAIFYNYLHPTDMHKDNTPVAHLSNIGPIKYKKPIKDFEITLNLNQKSAQDVAQIVSYSKINENDENNNVIHYQFAYSPRVISHKLGRKIFDSFHFFMRNIKPSNLVVDAFNELKKFQKNL